MFASPKRRSRTSTALELAAEPIIKNVLAIHTQPSVGTELVALEALVLHLPDEPRWITINNRKTKSEENVPVMTVLLGDSSGPIHLELWRDFVEQFVRVMEATSNDDGRLVAVRVTGVVRNEKSPVFPSINRLQSTERTVFEILGDDEEANLVRGPSDTGGKLFVRNFSLFATLLPFRANVVGFISVLADVTETANGAAMQHFTLQDNRGNHVACVAFGRHAGSEALAHRNEIICFFAKGVVGLGSGPRTLWMYDDGHIVLLKQRCLIPAPRVQIKMCQ
jgi:hypothetical protein